MEKKEEAVELYEGERRRFQLFWASSDDETTNAIHVASRQVQGLDAMPFFQLMGFVASKGKLLRPGSHY